MMKHAFNKESHVGVDTLVGARAVVSKALEPSGYVKVRGSLWRAQAEPGQGPFEEGASVIVQSVDGLTLHAQGFVFDPSGPLGFAATAGKTFELFAR